MIRRSPVEAVLTAVVAAVRASTGVTGLVGSSTAVYNHVQQGAAYPYVVVTAPSDVRQDTLGRFGSAVDVSVRVVSNTLGDQQAARIHNAIVLALSTESGSNPLTLTAPFRSLGVSYETGERYAEEIENGALIRHHVGLFRVWTEQTS